MKKLTLLILFWIVITAVYAQGPGYANLHILDPYNPEFAPGEILVKFRDEVPVNVRNLKSVPHTGMTGIDAFIIKYKITACEKVFSMEEKRTSLKQMTTPDGQVLEVPQLFNIYKLKADIKSDIKSMVEELKSDPMVEFAEPNYYFYSQATEPNDPMTSQQWYLGAFPGVNAKAAWDTTTGDTTQIIGIIDTGVDFTHPDLSPNIWTNWDEIPGNGVDDDGNGKIDDRRGWDFVNNDNNPMDDNSHGTHVAGIAAAKGNNSIGIAGIAWNSKIMPIKVMQSSGFGSSSDIANGVNYARLNGATILNLSLGSYGESLTLKTALENAYSTAVIVAAAGNDGIKIEPPIPYAPMFPACYSWILGVEASQQVSISCCFNCLPTYRACFSNYDPSGPIIVSNNPNGYNYEIKAPGVNVLSTFPNGGYHMLNGTSMAAPIVSGAVALIKIKTPTITNEEVFSRIIKSSNNGVLDISGAMNLNLIPDLYFQSFSVVDTLPGGDHDGVADAGETVQLCLKVKNAGGLADSVWSKIRFAPYEDTTVATILDSTSYIGNISTYATMIGNGNPLKIKIKSTTAHNRDIVFTIKIFSKNTLFFSGTLILTVTNAVELGGSITGVDTLFNNRLYLVKSNLGIPKTSKLIIQPNTKILINPGVTIVVDGQLWALGKPDSMIVFTSNSPYQWANLHLRGNSNDIILSSNNIVSGTILDYVLLEKAGNGSYTGIIIDNGNDASCRPLIRNSIIRDCDGNGNGGGISSLGHHCNAIIKNSEFHLNNSYGLTSGACDSIIACNIYNNITTGIFLLKWAWSHPCHIQNNNIYSNQGYDITTYGDYNSIVEGRFNYFGFSDSLRLQDRIFDYSDDFDRPLLQYFPYLHSPSPETHGIVWKVLVDSVCINKFDNAYNAPNGLGIVGPGIHRFDVYFNRPMINTITPFLTFGVREPYTQRVVADSASWSTDSTIWTAYFNIGIETGDGIQRVRVQGAKDNDHFEIPIEDQRFEFVIQAAGSVSIEFMATPGIGKVYLEWNSSGTEDALGYNMYRYYNITNTTFSVPTRINTSLIIDTLYTDFNVIPDTTYHYYYKIVGTDLAESDSSKIIVAIPLAAANGDANGDLVVNVLDITTIIAYMINQNPQPFIFDAADVNNDNAINILDVIGVVNILTGKKKLGNNSIGSNTNPAYIWLDNDKIRFKSEGQVTAIQFELSGQNLDQIRLLMQQQGFEFATGIVKGKLIGIIYNLENRTITEGMLELIGIEGKIKPLCWGEVVAGDPDGQYVMVIKDKKEQLPAGDYELTAFPNPFKDIVTISYKLPEIATIALLIFNSEGKNIDILEEGVKLSGSYQLEWNGKGVPSGVYYCRLNGKTKLDKEFKNEVKIMLIK